MKKFILTIHLIFIINVVLLALFLLFNNDFQLFIFIKVCLITYIFIGISVPISILINKIM